MGKVGTLPQRNAYSYKTLCSISVDLSDVSQSIVHELSASKFLEILFKGHFLSSTLTRLESHSIGPRNRTLTMSTSETV